MIPGATCQSNSIHDTIDKTMDASDFTLEESENLSDIDDTEVCEFSDLFGFKMIASFLLFYKYFCYT